MLFVAMESMALERILNVNPDSLVVPVGYNRTVLSLPNSIILFASEPSADLARNMPNVAMIRIVS
jgi:hypothetical protein